MEAAVYVVLDFSYFPNHSIFSYQQTQARMDEITPEAFASPPPHAGFVLFPLEVRSHHFLFYTNKHARHILGSHHYYTRHAGRPDTNYGSAITEGVSDDMRNSTTLPKSWVTAAVHKNSRERSTKTIIT